MKIISGCNIFDHSVNHGYWDFVHTDTDVRVCWRHDSLRKCRETEGRNRGRVKIMCNALRTGRDREQRLS